MGSKINRVIILPGGQVNFYCKDGLSSIDVLQIQRIYLFGGNLKFVNCGAFNESIGLDMAIRDMFVQYLKTLNHVQERISNDFKKALDDDKI